MITKLFDYYCTCVEAEHEESDILDQHGDEAKQEPSGHGDGGVAPLGQHLLLHADQVDHEGSEDEPVEKHNCFKTSIPEESADHPEHEVEGAHGGGVGVVLPDDLDMLLSHTMLLKHFFCSYYHHLPDSSPG